MVGAHNKTETCYLPGKTMLENRLKSWEWPGKMATLIMEQVRSVDLQSGNGHWGDTSTDYRLGVCACAKHVYICVSEESVWMNKLYILQLCDWVHLIAHVDVSVLGQQQGHQVHAALLSCQVNGADALPCHRVGVCAVLQQCGPNVHLVLFGSDVERGVAILRQTKDMQGLGGWMELFVGFDGWGIVLLW